MFILGIETSCDETAASVALGKGEKVKILSNVVSSQIDIHKEYGGVIPEVAARQHVLNILPVIDRALLDAGLSRDLPEIDAIAVTTGPGLITSLMVGVETAKSLSYVWNKPVAAVNHIQGHIYANFIENEAHSGDIHLPAVILTVSGGHTLLLLMSKNGSLKTIGDTRDDAAGEAFDKAAKLMDLGYPGGPIISKLADEYKKTVLSNKKITSIPDKFEIRNPESQSEYSGSRSQRHYKYRDSEFGIILPRPMIDSPDLDFSFSGLKTALLYKIQKDSGWKDRIPEYCHEFQQAVIDVLISKTIKAAKKHKVKTVMIAGGVASNKELRTQFEEKMASQIPKSAFRIPHLNYCTDNAAMVASAGYFIAKNKKYTPWKRLKAECNSLLK